MLLPSGLLNTLLFGRNLAWLMALLGMLSLLLSRPLLIVRLLFVLILPLLLLSVLLLLVFFF